MKNFTTYALIILAVCGEFCSDAGAAVTTKVTQVRVDKDGKGIITFEDVIGATATCVASGFEKMLAFNSLVNGGKSFLAIALTAKLSGAQVYVVGTGSCVQYLNTVEDIEYINQI